MYRYKALVNVARSTSTAIDIQINTTSALTFTIYATRLLLYVHVYSLKHLYLQNVKKAVSNDRHS